MQRLLFAEGLPMAGPAAEIHTGCVGPIRYGTTSASRELIEAVLTDLLALPTAAAAALDPDDPTDR